MQTTCYIQDSSNCSDFTNAEKGKHFSGHSKSIIIMENLKLNQFFTLSGLTNDTLMQEGMTNIPKHRMPYSYAV